tara:strand:+ start:192 stop:485 length:294 start_codon:yes stop_codon:yes gene_type:complete
MVDLDKNPFIRKKLIWNFISLNEKDMVFKQIEKYKDGHINEEAKKNTLSLLFNYYNKYVSYDFPEISSLDCEKSTNAVVGFFESELVIRDVKKDNGE